MQNLHLNNMNKRQNVLIAKDRSINPVAFFQPSRPSQLDMNRFIGLVEKPSGFDRDDTRIHLLQFLNCSFTCSSAMFLPSGE